ncbi:MAG: CDP-alcohol phosphatidyltransferase family protein [Pseudomonadota bacterium]
MTISASPRRAPKTRPRELEDHLNLHFYHPLAARLAQLLVPTGITPNMVSVTGMLLIWGAAWSYTALAWPVSAILGFALHLIWHVTDGADGDLARLTGKSSPTGELVDGVCDYAGHIILYIALAAMLDDSIGWWSWLWASLAGASHIAQTNHAETQRRHYLWWVYGVPWLKQAGAANDVVFRRQSWFGATFGWIVRGYLRLANEMTPWSGRIDRVLEESSPECVAKFRDVTRAASARSLAFQKLVGPNPRTIILGVSMLLGSPLYYFLAECVLLNLILVASVVHHNRVGRKLAGELAECG